MQFVDVSAINAQSQFQGSFTPTYNFPQQIGTGFIGHTGHDGVVAGTLQYQEQPTVTYTPLQGAALVQQITTPITVDSLAQLFDSDWPIGIILPLVVDRISPSFGDYFTVVDDIVTLDNYGAIWLSASKSAATPAGSGNDSLMIYCDPSRAWVNTDGLKESEANAKVAQMHADVADAWSGPQGLQTIFADAYIEPPDPFSSNTATAQITTGTTTAVATAAIAGSSATTNPSPTTSPCKTSNPAWPCQFSIELRYSPAIPHPGKLGATQSIPLLRTRSAYGMLQQATKEGIEFITVIDADKFFAEWEPLYSVGYALLKSEEDISASSGGKTTNPNKHPSTGPVNAEDMFQQLAFQLTAAKPTSSGPVATGNKSLHPHRHFVALVKKQSDPGAEAWISTYYDGNWFYIDKNDLISKHNFALISELMTLQAVAASNAGAPTPTISVGGH
jgi:hypothetical protein